MDVNEAVLELVRDMHHAVCSLPCSSRGFYGDKLADRVERFINSGKTNAEEDEKCFGRKEP